MAERPSVTVVIPAWNDHARLDQCLAALAGQTLGLDRFDVVVADNGSQPPLRPVVPPGLRVTQVVEPTPGSYAARNRALDVARGDVLAFTDADCLPMPDWLAQGLRRLAEPDARGVAGGRIDLFATRGGPPGLGERYDLAAAFPVRRTIEDEGYAMTANLFVAAPVMAAVGPFAAALLSGGDREWCRRAGRSGYPPVFADKAVVRHPARTLQEILAKTRRVAGGLGSLSAHDAATAGPERSAGKPEGRTRRLLRVPGTLVPLARYREVRANARREGRPCPRSVFLVITAVQWTILAERIRLRLGGRPYR